MQENIEKLKKEFYKIQCKNWIPSKGLGSGAAGRTFEELLGVEENSDILPDYIGIELKTKLEQGRYPIHLFSCAFDNKPLENQRLLFSYGYPNQMNRELKKFNVTINGKKRKYFKDFTSFKLWVDYSQKVVRLLVYNKVNKMVERNMSWSFKELKSRLEHKLKLMALVTYKKYRIQEKLYFKYTKMDIYKLRSFERFLELIEEGKIQVTFKLYQQDDKMNYGKIMDKGTSFEISTDSIEDLFEKVESQEVT
ncbi:MAG: MvaI/BcnI restriction endonuclease family protein [Bacilli bacterium]|nr:MvaI/BcnI restriction endonuclease family protein [Bacilli bacterium]